MKYGDVTFRTLASVCDQRAECYQDDDNCPLMELCSLLHTRLPDGWLYYDIMDKEMEE